MTSMIFFTIYALLALFGSVNAIAIPVMSRDVVDPPVTNPNAQTVWTVGSTQTVTWNTSGLPPVSELTTPGMVVLGFLTSDSENLMLDNPLAKGFNLTDGQVSIVVPSVPNGINYIVALFGDSGNISPTFAIQGGSSQSASATPSSTTAAPSSTASPQSSSDAVSSSPEVSSTFPPQTASSTSDHPSTSSSSAAPETSASSSSLSSVSGSSSASSLNAEPSTNDALSPRSAGITAFAGLAMVATISLLNF
ncbi:hypothetical protein CERSUDRAFT_81416 [Gelatoporia subvermispora B]|uniref:Uncharacterized protein n=1 Tax=Ceriporiopsis subvermispora (strain B) TaxID=914234 RepID=M2QSV6_CERS8|nr:hypothetical protein CERSUDRAFT_81416 [Gelatoporia subvermispora B]